MVITLESVMNEVSSVEKLIIRNETEQDYTIVENITREAFWNLHVPGCDEHYVAHVLRKHEDFIPELDLVAELDGQVVGNIMYTKARLIDESKNTKIILTFGPLSVLPEFQRRGISKTLLEHSFEKAMELGFDTIVIFGHPGNYVSHGFKSCKKYNVCLDNDLFPTAMLVKELRQGALDGRKWYYQESPAYKFDSTKVQEFDIKFVPKEEKYQASQEEFYVYGHSIIR